MVEVVNYTKYRLSFHQICLVEGKVMSEPYSVGPGRTGGVLMEKLENNKMEIGKEKGDPSFNNQF